MMPLIVFSITDDPPRVSVDMPGVETVPLALDREVAKIGTYGGVYRSLDNPFTGPSWELDESGLNVWLDYPKPPPSGNTYKLPKYGTPHSSSKKQAAVRSKAKAAKKARRKNR